MTSFIEATAGSGKEFYRNFSQRGKVVMLNMLRFKRIADYSKSPELEPINKISGEVAYELYVEHILPLLKKAGSKILFYGKSSNFLIGPENEKWDNVLLVEHESVAKFIEFSQQDEYLKYAGHRAASLEDSRLLPMTEK